MGFDTFGDAGKPVHIGFQASTAAITEGIDNLLSAYNKLYDVGSKYATLHGSHRLLNEVSAISNHFSDALAAVGISSNESRHLQLNQEQFSAAISGNDASEHFNTLNQFKSALSGEVNRISIDPMRYINKVIVEYKNPGKTGLLNSKILQSKQYSTKFLHIFLLMGGDQKETILSVFL